MIQKISNRVFLVNAKNVPVEDLIKQGAKDVKVQYLIDEQHGSNRFSLRLYTVPKGGHTSLDQHEYEHQVYVLSGHGLLRETEQNQSAPRELREGDVIFVPSNAIHQFLNEQVEPFVFLCVKGNPKLYDTELTGGPSDTPSDDSSRNYC
jgi:quercetin dioxygenase-like cupin family protein